MKISELRNRVDIYKMTRVPNATQGFDFVPVFQVETHCKLEAIFESDFAKSDHEDSEVTHRATFRHRTDIDRNTRLHIKDDYYKPLNVIVEVIGKASFTIVDLQKEVTSR